MWKTKEDNMGLQLKGTQNTNDHLSKNDLEGGEADPWDVPQRKLEDEPYSIKTTNNTTTATLVGEGRKQSPSGGMLVKLVVALVVCGFMILVGKIVVSNFVTEGEEISHLLAKSEADIAKELGVTFADRPEWVPQIHQYSKGKVSVRAAEEIGIVYIDGKQVGVHVNSKKYRIFNVQLGQGEREMNKNTTYPFVSFLSILNDMAEGKTTTYFYYRDKENDCMAITVNDTTNRVTGITYFNDFKLVMQTIERF